MRVSSSSGLYFLFGSFAGCSLLVLGPFSLRRVDGPSMRPALNPQPDLSKPIGPSDVVLVRNLPSTSPKDKEEVLSGLLGRVVCVRHPRRPDTVLIKRITSLQSKSYSYDDDKKVGIPPGRCWISSDAGRGYADSRLFGPVETDSILAVAIFIVWPPSRVGPIPTKSE